MKLRLLLKITVQMLVFIIITLMMFTAVRAQETSTPKDLIRLYRNNDIERMLSISKKGLSEINQLDELRLLGEVATKNGVYDLSVKSFDRLFEFYPDKVQSMDVINYCQALIETNQYQKVNSVISSHPFNNQRVIHMREVAEGRGKLLGLDDQQINSQSLKVKIFTDYGISRKGDSVFYCTHPLEGKRINLIETAIILSGKKHISALVSAEFKDDNLINIMQEDVTDFASKGRNEFIGMHKVKNSKDVFYSLMSKKDKSMK
ncbi:hypothetical protein QUH73_20750, partial [Labilibaculum sp. K2S]|uniref:hypothetical protein n=1 Tax=Labilibaculum sp. K2S TaxID=3056386 RepID=UPI0025A3254F